MNKYKHEHDGTLTEWTCPNCGAKNEDDEEVTTLPLCETCGESFDWHQVPHDCHLKPQPA